MRIHTNKKIIREDSCNSWIALLDILDEHQRFALAHDFAARVGARRFQVNQMLFGSQSHNLDCRREFLADKRGMRKFQMLFQVIRAATWECCAKQIGKHSAEQRTWDEVRCLHDSCQRRVRLQVCRCKCSFRCCRLTKLKLFHCIISIEPPRRQERKD